MLKKVAALATGAALALSFPAAVSADKGGVPNSNSQKPCPTKGKGAKKDAPNDHGKKCGFNKGS
jgi:hypothetical protein